MVLQIGFHVNSFAAAPSRTCTYTAGQIISPTCVSENEDNIFSWTQAGVDTYRNASVPTAAIQDAAVTTAKIATDAVTAATIVADAVGNSEIAANSVDGTNLAIGSDAQGDVIYYNGTDYVRLAAGTSGRFLQTQGASANPTWAAAGIPYVAEFTRARDGATASVAYTGVGFVPSAVLFICGVDTDDELSVGLDDGTDAGGIAERNAISAGTWSVPATTSIQIVNGSAIRQDGNIASFDTDGFTISWVNTGSPAAGTITCSYIAFR